MPCFGEQRRPFSDQMHDIVGAWTRRGDSSKDFKEDFEKQAKHRELHDRMDRWQERDVSA